MVSISCVVWRIKTLKNLSVVPLKYPWSIQDDVAVLIRSFVGVGKVLLVNIVLSAVKLRLFNLNLIRVRYEDASKAHHKVFPTHNALERVLTQFLNNSEIGFLCSVTIAELTLAIIPATVSKKILIYDDDKRVTY